MMDTTKTIARQAGRLYFLLLLTGPIGLLYVPAQLQVHGDAMAAAERVRASGTLLRVGIASELFHQVVLIYLVTALYRLFKAVNERDATLLVILGALVSVPIMFVNVLNEFAAMMLLSGAAFLSAFDVRQLNALAIVFMRLHGRGIDVASIFWGLWLFPFGMLVIRSRFIPWALGALLLAAGAGYVVQAAVSVLLPEYGGAVAQVTSIAENGELPIILWLLIWGAREQPSGAEVV